MPEIIIMKKQNRLSSLALASIALVATALTPRAAFPQPIPSRDLRVVQPAGIDRLRNTRFPIALGAHTVIGSNISDAFWSPGFNEIAIAGSTNSIYSVHNGTTTALPAVPQAWSTDGSRLALRTTTDSTIIWNAASHTTTIRFFKNSGTAFWNQNDSRVVSGPSPGVPFGGVGGITRVWSVATGGELFKLGSNNNQNFNDANQQNAVNLTMSPEWSSDGNRLLLLHTTGTATANTNNTMTRAEVYEGASWQRILSVSMANSNATIAHFSPDNAMILMAESTLEVRNASTGALLKTMPVNSTINSASWNNNGTRIVTATFNARYQLWDVSTGALVRTLDQANVSTSSLFTAAFSPNGNRVMTVLGTKVKIFDTNTGTLLQTFEHASPVRVAKWRPSGDGVLTIEITGLRGHVWKVN